MKKIILLVFFIILSTIVASGPSCKIDKSVYHMEVYNYNKLYNSVLQSIKEFEGLKLEAYYCPAGYKTIGYGHLIRDYEAIDDSITIQQADSLLINDFEESISTIVRILKYGRYDQPEKTLALAHFVFNIGAGGFEKSTLLHLIKQDKPIKYEMLKWVHYRDVNNKLIISNNLKNMRLYEISLYSNIKI